MCCSSLAIIDSQYKSKDCGFFVELVGSNAVKSDESTKLDLKLLRLSKEEWSLDVDLQRSLNLKTPSLNFWNLTVCKEGFKLT